LLSKLQRVINASARLILRVRKRDSIRSHLRSLNWLCVNDRITFRIATLTYTLFKWLRTYLPDSSNHTS
jgi:hypothetical protein